MLKDSFVPYRGLTDFAWFMNKIQAVLKSHANESEKETSKIANYKTSKT